MRPTKKEGYITEWDSDLEKKYSIARKKAKQNLWKHKNNQKFVDVAMSDIVQNVRKNMNVINLRVQLKQKSNFRKV